MTEPLDRSAQIALLRLGRVQAILPLLAQTLHACPAMAGSDVLGTMEREAKKLAIRQAVRTGEFLLLLEELNRRGLRPVVLKGLVCRSLYPVPELRPSSDEDLWVAPEDYPAYREALLAYGLKLRDTDALREEADEYTFVDPGRDLYLEFHVKLFPADSAACCACNDCMEGALSRRVSVRLKGVELETLHPTDHLLYLLCHAYKHMLYGGVGVRQICDICLFAARFDSEIDWARIRSCCRELGIETLAAAFFRIGELHLDLPAPACFADLSPDVEPLLHDCMTGGLYGAEDRDRLHSSTMTLDAVAADRQGRSRRGVRKALFPSAATLSGRFPYLMKHPALLPLAWAQRFVRYAAERGSPSRSLRVGEERIELLRQYKVLR